MLVNSVYVYDDKIVIYYNVKEGKQISYIDACNDVSDCEAEFEGGAAGFGFRIKRRAIEKSLNR